jgi:hypothetical protein
VRKWFLLPINVKTRFRASGTIKYKIPVRAVWKEPVDAMGLSQTLLHGEVMPNAKEICIKILLQRYVRKQH